MYSLKVDDVIPKPWKNGGGITRELFTWPTPADWWLRISVADVDSDGPFSAYAGVDRWFGVLEGAGVELIWAKAVRHLHAGHSLLHFDGGMPPYCRLVGDGVRDLNIMHRRDGGRVGVLRARPGSRPPSGFDCFALFALDAAKLRDELDVLVRVDGWSLVWGEHADLVLDMAPGGHAWWIGFDDVAAA